MTAAVATEVRALDRQGARRFVEEHILPVVDGYDRAGRVPEDVIAALSAARLWAPFLPVDAGGDAVPFTVLAAIHEEIGRGCSSVRSLLTVHSMVAWTVDRWGDPAQRSTWLPALASGARLGAVCVSEPGAGSDTTNLTTRAVRTGAGWRLSGEKTWITGGQRADVFLVYAQTGAGLAAFLVPRDLPGVEVVPIDDMLGTRAALLATVRLDGVEAGPEALLGPDAFLSGMVLTGMLDMGRLSVAAGSVGIVQACLDACVGRASERTVQGTRLRDLQLIRAKVSDMVADVTAGRLLVERAAQFKDAGAPEAIMAGWVAKYFASVAAARHASEAVQIHGAAGCAPGSPVARFYRDAKVMEIIEGSTELQRLTIAESAYQKQE